MQSILNFYYYMSQENELQNKNPLIISSKKIDLQILFNREKQEKNENISDDIDNLESM